MPSVSGRRSGIPARGRLTCARQVSWLAGRYRFAGLPSGGIPPVALDRERLAAYSCGVSSGMAATRQRTGFPLARGHPAATVNGTILLRYFFGGTVYAVLLRSLSTASRSPGYQKSR